MIRKSKYISLIAVILTLALLFAGCAQVDLKDNSSSNLSSTSQTIPEYTNSPYVTLNNNIPSFNEAEITDKSFENYSELDSLGRCGVAQASVGIDIMPTEDRGEIGQVKPTGWHTVKYDIVDGKYLYNRCHLIGFQLTGENANRQNLITGTRYFNVDGMLPFENLVADYVKETENHVMYRVSPVYDGENLVAKGVQMEAYSVEDDGEGVCFNVFVYNIQPGVTIDYATGESYLSNTNSQNNIQQNAEKYILNISSKKFHKPDCDSAENIKNENKKEANTTREKLVSDGYSPCKSCNP